MKRFLEAVLEQAMAAELDEKLAVFRQRRLKGGCCPYVQIDARYEKVRVEGRIISQAALVAIGFSEQGGREILDWHLGDSESEETWGGLFRELKDRGLQGLALVVSDTHKGIRKALARHFQGGSLAALPSAL